MVIAPAQVMRAAMQQSLADAELSHKKAKVRGLVCRPENSIRGPAPHSMQHQKASDQLGGAGSLHNRAIPGVGL
ncbi:hypothetical protein HaLaN_09377 [Haematococcus lacustris]|uniref:Uncharacterized protein n=1 Tax=Haematococcus lacustris TaxID=44745 RepID=A0A699Z3D3_HAELA|nr:hypothetical protein HaLaN_09377 [Haematococcus lacustris]